MHILSYSLTVQMHYTFCDILFFSHCCTLYVCIIQETDQTLPDICLCTREIIKQKPTVLMIVILKMLVYNAE